MKIEKHTFTGADPVAKRELVAEGSLGYVDRMLETGTVEVFMHTGPGADGYAITLTVEDVARWATTRK